MEIFVLHFVIAMLIPGIKFWTTIDQVNGEFELEDFTSWWKQYFRCFLPSCVFPWKSFQSFDNSNLWPRYHLKNYSCCEEPYPDITYIIRWGTGFIILHYCHPSNEQNTKTSAVLRLQYDHAMCSYQWNRWQTAIVVIVIIIIKNGQ